MTPRASSSPFRAALAPLVFLLAVMPGCFNDPGASPMASATESTDGTNSSSLSSSSDPTSSSSLPTTGGPTTGADSTATGSSGASSTTTGATTGSTGDVGVCGDGVIDSDEECDDGLENADDGLCTEACTKAFCGDGHLQPVLGEECDSGPANSNAGACTEGCTVAICGDGYTWEGMEECDDGSDNQLGVYGGCVPMTCTEGPHCGDGETQKPDEECDLGEDMNGLDGSACSGACKIDGKVIFATSKLYNGALGGLVGADDKCNTVAMEAGLANAGNFMAWLSTVEKSPATRMKHYELPYVLLSGATVVASSWAELTDGSIDNAITINEKGLPIDSYRAWTGTTAAGEASSPTCVGWKSEDKEDFGLQGVLSEVTSDWSEKPSKGCSYTARLICVEQ